MNAIQHPIKSVFLALSIFVLSACVANTQTQTASQQPRTGKPDLEIVIPNKERIEVAGARNSQGRIKEMVVQLFYVSIVQIGIDASKLPVFGDVDLRETFDTDQAPRPRADFTLWQKVDTDLQDIGKRWVLIDPDGTSTDVNLGEGVSKEVWLATITAEVEKRW